MSALPLTPMAAPLRYSDSIESEVDTLVQKLAGIPALAERFPVRWLAIQLLEGEDVLPADLIAADRAAVEDALAGCSARLRAAHGDDLDLLIADARYSLVRTIVARTLEQPSGAVFTLSDRIDRIVTHKYLGIPIFLTLMYILFNLVQNVSAPFLDWIDGVFTGPITDGAVALLTALNTPAWLQSLVVDGAIGGVGTVLVFVPGLLVLYFTLAVMEDTGYLARAAFVMDRAISTLGLHGKSFIPMILGFGCNVPAIYATRTIESRSARILTGLLIPAMSCSARLPVYIVFGMALFPAQANTVIWAMYITGIVVAALVGLLLSRTVFRGSERGAFILELPPYRVPNLRSLWRHTWGHTSGFVRKAGTVILGASIVLWLLLHLPWGVTNQRDSYFGQVSSVISPVFAPAGFATWQATGSLISGIMAKEIVVSSMAQVYDVPEQADAATVEEAAPPTALQELTGIVTGFGDATISAGKRLVTMVTPGLQLFPEEEDTAEDTALSLALRNAFTPLTGIAFLVFVLLYVPCIATVGAIRHEFGTRWMFASLALTMILPWVVSTMVYQGGRLLGFS